MKVIDLLNKIANGEEVPNFKYEGHRYEYSKATKMFDDLDDDAIAKNVIYCCELNDEVEIIEEDKKIEKLNEYDYDSANEIIIRRKINEIIDKVNELDKRSMGITISDTNGNFTYYSMDDQVDY